MNRSGGRAGAGRLGVLAALAIAGLAAVLLYPRLTESPPPAHDLLAQVQTAGAIQIAVRSVDSAAPNTDAARVGFDDEVAGELARRIGLQGLILHTDEGSVLAGTGGWDLALPSRAVGPGSGFAFSRPYYRWPVRAVVPITSAAQSLEELAGATLCVVTGSTAESWVEGTFAGSTAAPPLPPPAFGPIHRVTTDEACLAELADGRSAASVPASLSAADLAGRPAIRSLPDPIFVELRAVLARRAGPDPISLIAEIDRLLGTMAADGTLTQSSRDHFGGLDLTDSGG